MKDQELTAAIFLTAEEKDLLLQILEEEIKKTRINQIKKFISADPQLKKKSKEDNQKANTLVEIKFKLLPLKASKNDL